MPRGVIAGAIAVSAAAQLAVLPITLTHFNQLSTIGVVVNLGVVPLAGVATVAGLLAVAASFLSAGAAQIGFDAVWPVLLALRAVVALAAAVPGAGVYLPGPPRGALALYTGGPMRLDAGARVVAPFLWNRGHLRLAGAIATHQDADHAGGMESIRRRFGVAPGLEAETLARGPHWIAGAMISLLGPRRDAGGGAPGALRDPLLLGVARPSPPETSAYGLTASAVEKGARSPAARSRRGRNDEAIGLRVEYGLASFLLASDIQAAREQALVATRSPLAATVLKVAHHGSRTSSTPAFLGAVGPAIAVISVGPRNPYGHHDPGVLERLAAAGRGA